MKSQLWVVFVDQKKMSSAYPHIFRIVFEPFQPSEDRFSVLLPLSFAENYFQKVPGPADQRNLQ